MPRYVKTFEGVLSPDFCAEVIKRFEADRRVQADPQPDYSTRHYLNISECADWRKQVTHFGGVAHRLVESYFSVPKSMNAARYHEWSDDGYIVCRYAPGDACILHVDGQCSEPGRNGLRIATLIFYLNDVEDGGETFFPLQDLKVAPRRGRAVLFPIGHTHPHQVLKAGSPRYIMQTWITDPNLIVTDRRDQGAKPVRAKPRAVPPRARAQSRPSKRGPRR
jgi:hypothetical protein